jgi:hypothetical protein
MLDRNWMRSIVSPIRGLLITNILELSICLLYIHDCLVFFSTKTIFSSRAKDFMAFMLFSSFLSYIDMTEIHIFFYILLEFNPHWFPLSYWTCNSMEILGQPIFLYHAPSHIFCIPPMIENTIYHYWGDIRFSEYLSPHYDDGGRLYWCFCSFSMTYRISWVSYCLAC